jgi:hypothetical protein
LSKESKGKFEDIASREDLQEAQELAKFLNFVLAREYFVRECPGGKCTCTQLSPLEAEYLSVSRRMSPEQVQTVLAFISRRGLKDDGDNQLQNFITVSEWMLSKNQPITTESLDKAIGNIINNSRRPLFWKPRLQDSEKEKQAQHEAASQSRQDQRTELVGESTLAPNLREHRRLIQAALKEAEARCRQA